jgi:hypothetical protein
MSEDFSEDLFSDSGSRPELPAPDLDFLIYSLRLQTEMSLGILPLDDIPELDLELASHHIDLLAMLQEKTKGNLTVEEQRTLDNSLSELRMRFVEAKEERPAR